MKFQIFIFTGIFISAFASEDLAKTIINDGMKCIKETNLGDKFIEMIQKFKFEDMKPMRNYFRCFTEKLDLWNDGQQSIDVDNFVDKYSFDLEKDEVKGIVNNCLAKQSGRWIVQFYQCLADSKLGSKVKKAQQKDEL